MVVRRRGKEKRGGKGKPQLFKHLLNGVCSKADKHVANTFLLFFPAPGQTSLITNCTLLPETGLVMGWS